MIPRPHTDQIDPAAMDQDESLARRLFLGATEGMADDALALRLRELCALGHGNWQPPSQGGPFGRPATHLFEVQLLGVTATGTTAPECAHNWRTVAMRLEGGV